MKTLLDDQKIIQIDGKPISARMQNAEDFVAIELQKTGEVALHFGKQDDAVNAFVWVLQEKEAVWLAEWLTDINNTNSLREVFIPRLLAWSIDVTNMMSESPLRQEEREPPKKKPRGRSHDR